MVRSEQRSIHKLRNWTVRATELRDYLRNSTGGFSDANFLNNIMVVIYVDMHILKQFSTTNTSFVSLYMNNIFNYILYEQIPTPRREMAIVSWEGFVFYSFFGQGDLTPIIEYGMT